MASQQVIVFDDPLVGTVDRDVFQYAFIAILIHDHHIPGAGLDVAQGQGITIFEHLVAEMVFAPVFLAGGREIDFVDFPRRAVDEYDIGR